MTKTVCLLVIVTGCSFVGAGVPRKPPPPERCPSGVVIADMLGAAATMLPVVFGVTALVQDSAGANLAVYVVPPSAIVAATYIASAIYGIYERRRCDRMTEDAQLEPARPRAAEPARKQVIGDKPLHCAITEQDVGECFLDEGRCAAAAASAAVTCEVRTTGWCFDVSQPGGRPAITCAASAIDCDARRVMFSSDRTAVVTTCGVYVFRP